MKDKRFSAPRKQSASGPPSRHPPFAGARNIGPTIAARLTEAGIRSLDDLRRVGAVGAYRRIVAARQGESVPVCYYLYSLEGALRDTHWDALPERSKNALLAAVGRKTRPRKR